MDNAHSGGIGQPRFVQFANFSRAGFLCGAKWRTMEKEARNFAVQAREMAPEGTKAIVLYDAPEMERFRMAGYSPVFRRGAFSLALCTALDQDKGEGAQRIHIFELQDETGDTFFWLLYHSSGILDNDGDTVGTEEYVLDCAAQLQQDAVTNSQVELEIVRYGFRESVEYLESVLNRHFLSNKKLCRFRVFERDYRKLGIALAGIGLLLGAGALGLHQWHQIQAKRLAEELAAQQTARAQAEIEILRRNAYPRIWQDMPRPAEILPLLVKEFNSVQPYIDGWEYQGAIWKGKTISVAYAKSKDLPYSPAPGTYSVTSPFTSTVVVNLALPGARGPEELLPYETAFATVARLTLGRPYKHTEKWNLPESREVTSSSGDVKVRVYADFQTVNIELAGMSFLSPDIAQIVDMPGMVLQSVERTRTGEWKVAGVLYVQKQK